LRKAVLGLRSEQDFAYDLYRRGGLGALDCSQFLIPQLAQGREIDALKFVGSEGAPECGCLEHESLRLRIGSLRS